MEVTCPPSSLHARAPAGILPRPDARVIRGVVDRQAEREHPADAPPAAVSPAPPHRSRVQPTYCAHDRRVKGDLRADFSPENRPRPRHEVDRSDHRAASPTSRVVGVALDAARRPRAQPTELRARDTHEQGPEGSRAGSRRPSTSGRAFVPRLADSCVFPDARIAPRVLLALDDVLVRLRT